MVAARSESSEELKNVLREVRLIGGIKQSGPWSWSFVFYLHFKELDQALKNYAASSLSASAHDGAWKLSLFGLSQTPFSMWFDASLATERGMEKGKDFYESKPEKLAKQFGLSDEERKTFRDLAFEEAVTRLLDLQVTNILDAFQRFSIPHDPNAIRETLLKPTSDELDSELGNLPRLLEGVGLFRVFE